MEQNKNYLISEVKILTGMSEALNEMLVRTNSHTLPGIILNNIYITKENISDLGEQLNKYIQIK